MKVGDNITAPFCFVPTTPENMRAPRQAGVVVRGVVVSVHPTPHDAVVARARLADADFASAQIHVPAPALEAPCPCCGGGHSLRCCPNRDFL